MLLGCFSSWQKKNPMNIEVFFSKYVLVSRQQIVRFGCGKVLCIAKETLRGVESKRTRVKRIAHDLWNFLGSKGEENTVIPSIEISKGSGCRTSLGEWGHMRRCKYVSTTITIRILRIRGVVIYRKSQDSMATTNCLRLRIDITCQSESVFPI